FNPDGKASECTDFGACLNLARYLRALPARTGGVSTVAYVHGDVRRHSVLAVLACSKVEMAERGRIGQIVADGKSLDRTERTAYQDLSAGRSDPLVVRKMHEPNLELYRGPAQWRFTVPLPFGLPAIPVQAGRADQRLFDRASRPPGAQLALDS